MAFLRGFEFPLQFPLIHSSRISLWLGDKLCGTSDASSRIDDCSIADCSEASLRTSRVSPVKLLPNNRCATANGLARHPAMFAAQHQTSRPCPAKRQPTADMLTRWPATSAANRPRQADENCCPNRGPTLLRPVSVRPCQIDMILRRSELPIAIGFLSKLSTAV